MTDLPAADAPAGDAAALWLRAQHDVAGRAAHEIKNALNGVSVNLAVAQSRLRRDGAPATITRFVDTAVDQFELLTGQVEALLGVVRAAPAPADVARFARQLVTLLAGTSRDGGPFTFVAPADGIALTALDPLGAHAAIAAALAAALDAGAPCECEILADDGGPVRLTIRTPGRRLAGIDANLPPGLDAARPGPSELVLTFPAARGPSRP